jgi:hypothetical protein
MGRNFDAPKCDCRALEQFSREPSVPIEFDAKLNEYHIRGAVGDLVMIYYCPFCGGRTPDSRRDELFMHVTRAETERLKGLTRGLKTLDDVLDAFGPPDFDHPTGLEVTSNDSTGRPKTTWYRQLTFRGLSDTANLQVAVGFNNLVQFSSTPKDIAGAEEQDRD